MVGSAAPTRSPTRGRTVVGVRRRSFSSCVAVVASMAQVAGRRSGGRSPPSRSCGPVDPLSELTVVRIVRTARGGLGTDSGVARHSTASQRENGQREASEVDQIGAVRDDVAVDGPDARRARAGGAGLGGRALADATAEVSDHREAVEVLRQMMNVVDQQLSPDGTPVVASPNGHAMGEDLPGRDRAPAGADREPPVARGDPRGQGDPESRADQRGSARARVDGEAPGGLPRRRGPDRRAGPRGRCSGSSSVCTSPTCVARHRAPTPSP